MNKGRKLLNKKGALSVYVVLLLATTLLIISISMLKIFSTTQLTKVKDDLTQEEANAVNYLKTTFDEYTGLSVEEKIVEDIEYNGNKYSIEIVPTTDKTEKKVVKEYNITNKKIDSGQDYWYDTNYTAGDSPAQKQNVYGTVSAISNTNAKNYYLDTPTTPNYKASNQYVIYTNNSYKDTTLPTAIGVNLRGLVHNNTTIADLIAENYVQQPNGKVVSMPNIDKVRVTKNNNDFKYVQNYPSSLTNPFSLTEQGIFLIEYLDTKNNTIFWTRYRNGNQPNTPISNLFANKNYLNDNNDRRPVGSRASDVPVNSVKNAFIFTELPKFYSSLESEQQTIESEHVTDSLEEYKTVGVSLNVTWDYMKACVAEQVKGYPLSGELSGIGQKKITDITGSNCLSNQNKITYDVSMSKGRNNSGYSYPYYTNWSFLPTGDVEKVFDYYKNNWGNLFQCIKGSGEEYCQSNSNLGSTPKTAFTNHSRQSVKENFLLCAMDGYKTAVVDSNERWVRFSNAMYDELEKIMATRIEELKVEYGVSEVEEYGEMPQRPTLTGPKSFSEFESTLNAPNSLNDSEGEGEEEEGDGGDGREVIGDGQGEVIYKTETAIGINLFRIAEYVIENSNFEAKFKAELARKDYYQVPCIRNLGLDDNNYKYTVDEIPSTQFNLDILTNTATPVKITTKHKAEVNNARTSYALTLFNGTDNLSLYNETDKNSANAQYKNFNKTNTMNVDANYTGLNFANLGKDFDEKTNRLQFKFKSFNRNLEHIKVEYNVIDSMKYEYHIYNSKGERLYYTEQTKKNSL